MSRSSHNRKPAKRVVCPGCGRGACFVLWEEHGLPSKLRVLVSSQADKETRKHLSTEIDPSEDEWLLDNEYYDSPDVWYDWDPVPELTFTMSERLTAAEGVERGELQEKAS